jgi:hypothetical protein
VDDWGDIDDDANFVPPIRTFTVQWEDGEEEYLWCQHAFYREAQAEMFLVLVTMNDNGFAVM